ncbi:hypothetical protein LSUE1_G000828 [Lachnellula suecica]|uniref:Acetoacetate decarboxylase n=1 Tax=Lachnellula suecica TaxID=602035 RepID=A0A8T9CH57_9HELO|nr:hypothetical protein LSUE1_G000828 [Lachnellula suecica]
MAAAPTGNIKHVPAPWKLKGTIYSFMMYISAKDAASLSSDKSFLYAPLEAASSFANCQPVGGLGMVQVLRYSESPVGPYDELLIVPGNFERQPDGKVTGKKPRNLMVSRIYVSHERTCWNGRTNWNIPKHLARFQFDELPNGATSISVYPRQADSTGVESKSSDTPFFSATFKTIPYVPSFPASTSISKYVGLDLALVQPPLPEGKGVAGELPGTKEWCKIVPAEYSSKTSLGWWDLQRKEATETEPLLGGGGGESRSVGEKNWWPGLGRWRIGMKMKDADIEFPEGERWAAGSGDISGSQ